MLDEEKFHGVPTEKLLSTTNYPIIVCNPSSPRLNKPIYAPDNFAERINLWLSSDFHWTTWSLFCRRDFWIANQIYFPPMPVSDDIPVNFNCLCSAEKILRVPNLTYIYRQHEKSVTHDRRDLEKWFRKWLSNLNCGFNEFNKIMSRFEFFAEHADYRYAVLDWFFNRIMSDGRQFPAAYAQIHPASLNQFVQKEFHPDCADFAAYLFNTVNIQRLQIMRLQQELKEFRNK